ncbi:cytochrome c family protein [Sphingomonas lacunae]|uniref:Cytochrome c family protein n=1 Tax=Sphingomonas lacunae TaxID=2698828 RepID=A0A6M4ASF5_9SPHN|nr:cytochrome c family protein [Sphingomonas lacunae]QJQ31984.1 cytochrome c family protein [Sphingomonas lacunae]
MTVIRKLAFASLAVSALGLAACGQPADSDSAADAASSAPADSAPEAAAVTFASLTGDAAKGETVYNQCRACHSVEPDRNGVGPSLHGVVGRVSGAVPGYAYSEANKAGHLTWTPEVLFNYLENPSRMVQGTKMSFMLRDPQQRADVIAYLETLK